MKPGWTLVFVEPAYFYDIQIADYLKGCALTAETHQNDIVV